MQEEHLRTRQTPQIRVKLRIGDIDAVRVPYSGFPVGGEGGDGKAHGDAVIVSAVNDSPVKRLSPADDH